LEALHDAILLPLDLVSNKPFTEFMMRLFEIYLDLDELGIHCMGVLLIPQALSFDLVQLQSQGVNPFLLTFALCQHGVLFLAKLILFFHEIFISFLVAFLLHIICLTNVPLFLSKLLDLSLESLISGRNALQQYPLFFSEFLDLLLALLSSGFDCVLGIMLLLYKSFGLPPFLGCKVSSHVIVITNGRIVNNKIPVSHCFLHS
jgi:hypothetical protein